MVTNSRDRLTEGKKLSLEVVGEDDTSVKRAKWANQTEFVLSCIGYAIGIGNIWRFPFLVYRNGGSFVVIFILMLITMGLPIFYMELCIGQYTGLGPVEAYRRMSPAFGGLGICTVVVIAFVTIYYMVIVSWTLFYVIVSFNPRLGWAYCDNTFNTDRCYSGLENKKCQDNSSMEIFYNRTCRSIKDVCANFYYYDGGNTTHCFNQSSTIELRNLTNPILSSEEYFNDYVLGIRDATWYNWGGIRWELLGCLTLSWIICYFCLIKGLQSVGKIVYFTALFPYFVLIALLIRGVTLKGASAGIMWFITPKVDKLLSAHVWADAASQVYYSLGIGCGSLITLSSYSKFTNNCHRDAIFVTLANLFTSMFAGFTIFAIIGYLADQTNAPIDKTVRDGPGLAFVAYPEAVVLMPLPNLWAVLFFFMLFILGLGSQFGGIQAITSAILDERPNLRKYESLVVLGICTCGWLLALPMMFDGGIYLYTLIDWNTASWAVLLIGIAEVGVPAWCYGCNKFLDNIGEMKMSLGRVLRWYWWFSWMILAPITSLSVFIYQMCLYKPATYNHKEFPKWADAIGILIGLATLAPLPLYFFYRVWKGPRNWSLFRTTDEWGPSKKPQS